MYPVTVTIPPRLHNWCVHCSLCYLFRGKAVQQLSNVIVVERFPLSAGPADTFSPVLRPFLTQTPIDTLQYFHSLHIATGDCAINKCWVTTEMEKRGRAISISIQYE